MSRSNWQDMGQNKFWSTKVLKFTPAQGAINQGILFNVVQYIQAHTTPPSLQGATPLQYAALGAWRNVYRNWMSALMCDCSSCVSTFSRCWERTPKKRANVSEVFALLWHPLMRFNRRPCAGFFCSSSVWLLTAIVATAKVTVCTLMNVCHKQNTRLTIQKLVVCVDQTASTKHHTMVPLSAVCKRTDRVC